MAAACPSRTLGEGSVDTRNPTFLQLQSTASSSTFTRRLRPLTLESFERDVNRVPLRLKKVHEKESMTGLRNLFGRSSRGAKGSKSGSDAAREPRSRPSIADIRSWPHILQACRSEAQLSTVRYQHSPVLAPNESVPSLPATTAPSRAANYEKHKLAIKAPPRSLPPAWSTWEPPPLFQAYPQAIRHIHLPATVTSADSLLRYKQKKEDSNVLEDPIQRASTTYIGGQSRDAASQEGLKKRHRRNTSTSNLKLVWTTKIFVLVTSGYLLQYSGEGHFDRSPEKILQLSGSSAAFASDCIPGRHWVLQVCASMNVDGTPAPASRSLLSRVPFRSARRNTSNLLMVFDSADDMESWIVLLRTEIEAFGGRKSLSETGKPKFIEALASRSLRSQASQRTLVVRDPDRFSRIINPNQASWQEDGPENGYNFRPGTAPDQSPDDASTTTSIASHDGRQLDTLREGGTRLSYLSSGTRTVITSADSTPAGSPMRESFSSDVKKEPRLQVAPKRAESESRPGPASLVVSDRRQSLQHIRPVMAHNTTLLPSRPQSTVPDTGHHQYSSPSPTILSFHLPNALRKRLSLVRDLAVDGPQVHPSLRGREPLPKGVRRVPSTSPPITRPLSKVADPSLPISPQAYDTAHQNINDNFAQPTHPAPVLFSPIEQETKEQLVSGHSQRNFAAQRCGSMPIKEAVPIVCRAYPRQFSSLQNLRLSATAPQIATRSEAFHPPKSTDPPPRISASPVLEGTEGCARSCSSMDSYLCRSRTSCALKSAETEEIHAVSNRPSMLSLRQPVEVTLTDLEVPDSVPRSRQLSVTGTLPTSQESPVTSTSRNVYNRRSMQHLTDGPPPAPPPSCALPPLPQKSRQSSLSHWNAIHI